MTAEAEHYARVHAIFDRARGLSGAERGRFLEQRCGDDDAMRAEVEELLSHLEADAFPESDIDAVRKRIEDHLPRPLDGIGPDSMPEHVGGYRLQRRIGQGGMGVVYEALQESPRRKVAIKILHPHLTSPERLRRFRQEAEVLGRLQHPCIARIYEAGTFDCGRGEQPFFAMELVDGVGIRLYVERERLDLRARLALLARVADGVQHAHERGVIHRDLKPDNVLVDDRGRPVILDFGVAHAREPSDVLSTMKTEEGVLLGTLAYMAPEQLSGMARAITPRVDVYALGVLAYELLSERLPHDVGGLPLPAAVRFLTDEPARRLGALDPTLRGDVETMVSTALAREPARRYASAQAFAADIRRYLDDLPITARPTSRIYRARKYARRHPSLVGSIVVMALAAPVSVFFAARAARQRNVAAHQRDVAEATSTHLRTVVEELAQPFPVATRFVELRGDERRTLVQGDRLAKGDHFVLEVRSLVDLNLYVFNQDDTGFVDQIFPIEGVRPVNPLSADVPYLLPGTLGATQVSWIVDSEGGTERFLLLALPADQRFSRTEWDLDHLVSAVPSAYGQAGDTRGVQPDPASGAPPAQALGNQPLSAFETFRSRIERLGRGWVRVVQFESGPRSGD